MGDTLKATEKRLAILTDVVKTANSILEPGKVVELVMEKIRQLIPSEAWSLLMVDEEKQELICKASGLAYPVRDGIPVMLESEARQLTADEKLGETHVRYHFRKNRQRRNSQ